MTATRITIELSPREVERLDAWIERRNRGIVGRPTTREEETRRILLEELQITDTMPGGFWGGIGKGASNRTEPGG